MLCFQLLLLQRQLLAGPGPSRWCSACRFWLTLHPDVVATKSLCQAGSLMACTSPPLLLLDWVPGFPFHSAWKRRLQGSYQLTYVCLMGCLPPFLSLLSFLPLSLSMLSSTLLRGSSCLLCPQGLLGPAQTPQSHVGATRGHPYCLSCACWGEGWLEGQGLLCYRTHPACSSCSVTASHPAHSCRAGPAPLPGSRTLPG